MSHETKGGGANSLHKNLAVSRTLLQGQVCNILNPGDVLRWKNHGLSYVSLYSLRWPWTGDPPASASQVFGLEVCPSAPFSPLLLPSPSSFLTVLPCMVHGDSLSMGSEVFTTRTGLYAPCPWMSLCCSLFSPHPVLGSFRKLSCPSSHLPGAATAVTQC